MRVISPAPCSLARRIAILAVVSLTACSPCNDGLGRTDWEARERVRAAAGLPRARRALTTAMDSAWTIARPPDQTDQAGFVQDEEFSIGGVYGFGGPLYRQSCTDPDAFPSYFRLRHVYAAITTDSLVVLSGEAQAIDTTKPSASSMHPRIERQALSLREVTGAWLSVVDPPRGPLVVTTTVPSTNGATIASPPPEFTRPRAAIVLRCASRSTLCDATLPVALEDSSTGRAFAAHLLASARRLQGQR